MKGKITPGQSIDPGKGLLSVVMECGPQKGSKGEAWRGKVQRNPDKTNWKKELSGDGFFLGPGGTRELGRAREFFLR